MDPISIASNTAALLSLTIQVKGALYGYWDQASLPSVQRFLYQLDRLRTSLESLERASLESGDLFSLNQLPKIFRGLKKTLVFLGSKLLGDGENLDVPSHSSMSVIWEAYNSEKELSSLPVTKVEAEDMFNELQIQVEQLRAIIPSPLAGSPARMGRSEIPEALAPSKFWSDCADYNSIHAAAQESCVKGSGVWLLSHVNFRIWVTKERIDPHLQNNMLYCFGRPGSGKTILASVVIEELKNLRRDTEAHLGFAYFYFSYRAPSPIYKVVLALLEQLYVQSPTMATEVRDLENHQTQPRELPLAKLTAVLMSVAARFHKTYIVLDALDECPGYNTADLDNLISSISSSQCRLFVTARPSHELAAFKQCPQIPIKPSFEDVSLFVRSRFKIISEQRSMLDETQENQIVDALVAMGNQHGMFLLVELQIKTILKSCEHGFPEGFNLTESLGRLTGDLSKVYDDQIRRIAAQKSVNAKMAGQILSWLYHNAGSMPAGQLEDILRSEMETWESKHEVPLEVLISRVCLDLARYNPTDKVVSFFHFSFHEYLEQRERQRRQKDLPLNPNWPLPASVLGGACTHYLLRDEVAPVVSNITELRRKVQNHPFYEYAAINWSRLSNEESALDPHGTFMNAILQNDAVVLAVSDVIFQNEKEYWLCPKETRFQPIHFLTYFGCLGRVQHLPRFSLVERDFLGRTGLHIAAMMGHASAIKILIPSYRIRSKDNIYEISHDNLSRNVWHYVALGNNLDVARALLQEADVGSVEFEAKDSKGRTPLSYAAAEGHSEVLNFLLRECAQYQEKVNREDALRFAIQGGHVKAVTTLLSQGARPKHEYLIAAIDSGTNDVVTLLLEYGVSIDSENAGSALHEATITEKTPILSSLIWNGANLETTDATSQTPLSLAVKNGYVEAVKLLLDAGSNPKVVICKKTDNVGSKIEVPAISWAAENGMVEIFKLLSNAGADSSSALMPAIEKGRYEIVHYLLESGIASHLSTEENKDAIRVAQENGYTEVAELLQNWKIIQPKSVKSEQDPHTLHTVNQKDKITPRSTTQTSSTASPGYAEEEKSSMPLLKEASINREVYSRPDSVPVQSPITGRSSVRILSKPRVLKGSRQNPYILLESPIRIGSLQLGSIVRDPANPLQEYAPSDQSYLRDFLPFDFSQRIHIPDFQMERNSVSSSMAGAMFGSFGLGASRTKENSLSIASPNTWRSLLSKHEGALNLIVNEPAIGEECRQFLKSGDTAYMVVGIFVMENSMVAYADRNVPGNNSSSSAATENFALSMSVGWEVPHTEQRHTITYNKSLIHCVQYRVLKKKQSIFGSLLSKRALDLTLGAYVEGAEYDTLSF